MKLFTKHNPFSNAFTLAEVLITLAIIGVVAAMTMPTLINNTKGAQFKTAYKKALSVLNQAVVMNLALVDYDFAGTTSNAPSALGEAPTDTGKDSLYKIFAERTNGDLMPADELNGNGDDIPPYKVAIKNDGTDASGVTPAVIGASNYVFRYQDGIVFTFDGSQGNCTEAKPCFGWIDANGKKGPNRSVSCTQSEDRKCTSKVTINDIFPIKFYDETVAPASAAARAVLYGSENEAETTEQETES